MKHFYMEQPLKKALKGSLLLLFFFCCSYQVYADTCPYHVTSAVTDASCSNSNDGTIDLTLTNATNPTFLWTTGATTEDISGLAPGVYSVDINDNNCIQTRSFTVGQADNTPPNAHCKNVAIQLGIGGTTTITPNYLDNGSSDNCGIASMTLSKSTFTCADLGLNTVTLTVTDFAGNTNTCTGSVLVQDLLPPTAICQSKTIYLDANGNASITVNDINNGSTDNCSIASMSLDKTNFTCADLGQNDVILTVTDGSGNSSTCTTTVDVQYNLPPTAVCQNIDVYLDASGNATISAMDMNNGSSSVCNTALTVSINKTNFTCADLGQNTVTLTVTDNYNNSSTCTGTVTVYDTTAPQITCPVDITTELTSGCTKHILLPLPKVVEACGGIVITAMTNTNVALILTPSGAYAGDFPLGKTTVTYKVDDGFGNWSMCSFDITVEDKLVPIINNLPADFTVSNDAGLCKAGVNWTAPTATDNCPGVTLVASHNPGDTLPVGITTVTYTATDAAGNITTESFDITVKDTEAPTLICKMSATLPGATITIADVYAGSSDNCGVDLSTLSLNVSGPITCGNLGQVSYTLSVEDIHGNIGTCSGTIDVIDNVPPTAVCQDVNLYLDANGTATLTPSMVDNGSTDNCGIASMTVNKTLFNCSHIGTQSVTLTVTDFAGNSSNCVALVHVHDTISPVVVPQPVTVYLDANGGAKVFPNDILQSRSDNCSIKRIQYKRNYRCSNVGVNNVNITVTDKSGNATVVTTTVTVLDTISPVLQCQNATIYLDTNGRARVNNTDVILSANDNCWIKKRVVSKRNFRCNHLGQNTVTVTVEDKSGNTASCTATVTVVDTISPIAKCKDATVMLDLNGQATISVTDINDGSTDNCNIQSINVFPTTFNCFNIGNNQVTLTVTDNSGNVSTCTANVNVVDMVFPTAKCKNITVQLDANGQASITGSDVDNGSFDNCGILNMTVAPNNFTCNDIGTNQALLVVTDFNGNTSLCNSIVTVEDTISPNVNCQDITVTLDANGQATITTADVNNGSTDNCGIASMSLSQTAFDCSHLGANTVTLTVTDVNGNTATCTSTVTVQGSGQGQLTCKNATIYVDANGQVTLNANDVTQSASGGCGSNVTLSVTPNQFDCSHIGQNNPVTVTATDGNGNATTCTANVTVLDTTAPNPIAKAITVQLDANGQASITANDVDNNSTDNCAITNKTVTPNTFDCSDLGTNTVTLTVTDASGNTASTTATVTVEDNINPTIVCNMMTLYLNQSGTVTATQSDLIFSMNDNCGIDSVDLGQTVFTCADAGVNMIPVTVFDAAGNSATCNAKITVKEGFNPTVITKDATVYLDANGQAVVSSADVDNGSTDNCGIVSLTVTPNTFDCSQLGTNQVTLKATDGSGNTAMAMATVTVLDTISPTAICQNITIALDANGTATITTADINNGSTDNCTIVSMTATPTTFSCADIGQNTVTLTVTDQSGNTSTCTSTVTVTGGGQPQVTCQDATVYLDANGNVTINQSDVISSVTGGCGSNTTVTISPNQFDCSNIGTNQVTVSVTDGNGNTANCTATVTVADNMNPTAICQDATVTLDANGQATITTADINNGSSDNCGIASMSVSPSTFDCSHLGANTVTLTVTDVNGNTATCTSTVTVKDDTNPTAICQDATIYINANGQATIATADINNGSSDNCGIASMSVSPSTFDCSHLGANTVTLTVTDAAGNTATCTSTVTVNDTISPTVQCQNVTVQIDANGNATIVETDVVDSKSDNCGTPTITLSNNTFGCADIGQNTVTITATDAAGNTATCTAIVTIEDNTTGTITSTPADCDDEIEICKDGTPNGASYTVALHGTPGDWKYKSTTHFPLTLIKYNDGTARIRGEIYNVHNPSNRWEVDVYLNQKMDLSTYQSTYNGTPWSQNGDPVSTWDYYIMDASKPNKMYGRGGFLGDEIDLTHKPVNLTHAFQVGDAASIHRAAKSLSGWFFFSNDYNGTGDFDFDLNGCQIIESTKETCEDGTPSSANYALILHGNNNGTTKYKSNPSNPLVLMRNADGTATITGEVQDINNSNKKWAVDVNLYQKMNLPTYQNNYSGTPWSQSGDPVSTWDYYIMDETQTNTFTGLGSLSGQSIDLTHKPTNKTKAFQIGDGASLYRSNPSLSGWFWYAGSDNGTGDFDFDLTNCVSDTACNGTATVEIANACQSTPSVVVTGTTTVDWNIANCYAGNLYGEFTPTISGNACVNVSASKFKRNSGGHSCNYGRPNGDGVGICSDGFINATFVDNASRAFRFDVTVPSNSTGTLASMNFWEYAGSPIQFLTTGNNNYTNNYPTKYGIRVLKDGVEIFKQIDILTSTAWSQETFNFTGTDFDYTGGEVFEFELYAYAPAGLSNTHYNGIWDIDEISVDLNCTGVQTPSYTYLWSNGATTTSISGLCPGDYDVTVTDDNNAVVFTGTTNVADDRVNCTPAPTPCNVTCPTGGITTFEYKTGSSSNDLSALLNHASYPHNPYNVHYLSALTQNHVSEKHGAWTRGYIIPLQTGLYDIYLSSDDDGKLWLSSDCDSSNKTLVGEVNGWTYYKQWTKYASQKTTNVYLEAGKPYYFEMMMKNGGGPGHWSIGWKTPNSSSVSIIDGKYVANYKCNTCTTTTNLALNKPSYQSSTCYGGNASRANDGNTNGHFSNGSVSYTCKKSNPYWELDLQGVHQIDEIKIWNRTDSKSYRLKNYYVFVSNVPFTSSNIYTLKNDPNNWYSYQTTQAGSPTTIPVGRTGRYVCVMIHGYTYLHMAEVEVFGCAINNVLLSQSAPVVNTANSILEQVESTDTETLPSFEINAYPNPFNDKLTLEAFVPEEEEYMNIRILNVDGKVVYTQNQMNTTGDVIQELNIPNLPNGMYILEATTAKQVKTVKLVKVGRP